MPTDDARGGSARISARSGVHERADKVRNRERILAAASAAFAERGLDVPMDDVAARAGLAVGTLYRHYATKEALMQAIVERTQLEIRDLTRRAIERERDDPFAVLADVLRQRIEAVAGNRAARAVLFGAEEGVLDGLAELRADAKAALRVLVDRAHAANMLRDDVDIDDIWTASCGVVAVMEDHPTPWRRHLQIVLDGLATRPR